MTVPRFDSSPIATAPRPSVRVPTDVPPGAFGTPDAGGLDLRSVDESIRSIAADAQKKADEIAYTNLDSQLSALETSVLHDPNTGAFNQRGKNAAGLPEQTSETWMKGVGQIAKGATTDRQRMAFDRAVALHWASINNAVQQHMSSEFRAYDHESTQGAVSNEYTAAVANYQDPARVQLAVARQTAILQGFGRRNGLADEEVQHMVDTTVSKTHVGVIDRMLANQQDLTAKAYYDRVKGQIAGDDSTQIEHALEEGSARGESQRQSDTILSRAANLTDAIAQVRQIKDPKVRDLTEQRVRQEYSEREAAQRQQREQLMGVATNVIEQTHDFTKIPPTVVAQLTVGERSSLREYADKIVKGTPVQTNWATYYQLQQLGSAEATRDAFLQTNLLRFRGQLGDTEFKQLSEMQASLRKGDQTATDRIERAQRVTQSVNDALGAAGIDHTPKPGTDDATKVALFRRAVDHRLAEIEQQTKKPPTEDDLHRTIDAFMVQGVVAGTGVLGQFETKKRAFEVKPDEKLVIHASDVPSVERARIEAALKRNRVPVSDEAVLRLYRQKLSGLIYAPR